jgi:MFS family permease
VGLHASHLFLIFAALVNIAAVATMVFQPKLYQFLVGLYGYDLGVIAQVIASDAFNAKFKPTDLETGAVVSVFTGGAFFGAMFAGPTGDALGRRLTIMIGAIVRLPKIHFLQVTIADINPYRSSALVVHSRPVPRPYHTSTPGEYSLV